MVDRLKIMCNKNSYGNLVEEIIMIAIESALEEISEKMRTRLECRYNWLGDTDGLYHSNGSTEFLSIHLKEYRIALSDCQYKNIYTLIENILQEKLYDREDGEFCADAGLVAVFLLDEVLAYNPDFDWYESKPWTTTLIRDFDGDIEMKVIHTEGVYDEDTKWYKKGEKWTDDSLSVVGTGNINFETHQTGF